MASVRVEFANAISNKTPHIVLDTRARKTLAQKFLEACGGSVDCQITREMLHKFAGMQTVFTCRIKHGYVVCYALKFSVLLF